MVVDKKGLITVLHAEGTNKISNKSRTLFSNIVYLGKNDSIDNYDEVTEDVWKNYIGKSINEEDSKVLKLQISGLENQLNEKQEQIYFLEDIVLDNRYELLNTKIELGLF